MRKPFLEASEALKAAGYRCDSLLSGATLVFGGEAICVTYFPCGSYSDNGGRNYCPAEVNVRSRWPIRVEYALAHKLGRQRYPAVFEALAVVPRSDVSARLLLEMAEEADRIVAGLLPEAGSAIEAAQAEEMRQRELAENARALGHLASGELVDEVLRLDAEGLLDNSALAGLKGIADRIRALRGDAVDAGEEAPPPHRGR